MDKKKLASILCGRGINRDEIVGNVLDWDRMREKASAYLVEHYDITPKSEKPDTQDFRKGDQRWKELYLAEDHRKGKERRVLKPGLSPVDQFRANVNEYLDICSGAEHRESNRHRSKYISTLFTKHADPSARIKELEEAGKLAVEQLEANYDDSERRVLHYRSELKAMKKLYQEVLEKNKQYILGVHGGDRQKIEQLEKQLKDTTANHTINHAALLETLSNVARLEKLLGESEAISKEWEIKACEYVAKFDRQVLKTFALEGRIKQVHAETAPKDLI